MQQTLRFGFVLLVLALGVSTNVSLSQPANDDCFNAMFVEPNSPATGFTEGATFDPVPPCDPPLSAPGVWYGVIGTGNTLAAQTCFGANFDTQINVFTGDCLALQCVIGNDNECGLQSSATWCSIAGQAYFILVSGAFGQIGFFSFVVQDNGVPCSEIPVLTIPELYANLPDYAGQTVTIRAQITDPETRLLVDNFGEAMIRAQPNETVILWDPLPPFPGLSDLVELTGIVDVDPTATAGFEARLIGTGGPPVVVAAVGEPPKVPDWRHLGWPAPPADCDPCKFAIFISGGIDAAQNYPGFWKDLADFYCYKRSIGYCEANIRVFYDNGTPRDGSIPAGVVDSAASDQIQAHIEAVAHAIAECKRNGQPTTAEVVVSNHGEDNGDIDLWDFDWITAADFRGMMQQLIDSGLTTLDIELGQCYGGEVMEELDSLDTKGTNVTGSSAADSNCTLNRKPDYSYWLNAKARALQQGKSLQEAIREANRVYDSLLTEIGAWLDRYADSLRAIGTHAESLNADVHNDIADIARDGRGRQQYSRSIPCSTYCQADTVQVTPGGRLEFEFTGNSSNCGNCEVYCLNAQGQRVKTTVWNWNIPGSRNFQAGQDKRRLDSGVNESGLYVFHNNNGRFTVKVKATNPPHVPPGGPRESSPNNPEEFAGFSMGWRSGNANEFSVIFANNYTTADSIGMLLDNLPRVLGQGGVGMLNVNFDILEQNDFWTGMEVWLLVLSDGLATITASCSNAEFSPMSIDINGPGEYAIPLGAISGTGTHTLTLSADNTVEWDCWALRTTTPTGMPPAVSDLVVQRVGDDIVLNWSAVPLADTYRIYTSPTPDGPWSPLVDVITPTYTHVGEAGAGDRKFYYVAAINEP